MGDLHPIAHELYGLPLGEFIEMRDAQAASARHDNDPDLATLIRRLRKPSATAWAVNMLARSQTALLEELVDLGGQLREAQASSDGDRLRSLDKERRRLMSAVTTEATAIATAHEQALGRAAVAGVDETMKAALADPEAGRAVLDGMLVVGLSAPGFGAVDLTDTVAIEPGASPANARRDDSRSAQLEAARKAVTAASRQASAAGKAAATARARLEGAVEQQADLEQQLAELRAQVEKLEGRVATASEKVRTGERDVEAATRTEGAALQAVDEAEARVSELES